MHLDERSDVHWQLSNQGGMATSTSFPMRIPTLEHGGNFPPSAGQGVFAAGDGLIPCGSLGSYGPTNLQLIPFGSGDVGQTFQMRVYGWRGTTGSFFNFSGLGKFGLLVPILLAAYTVTLGNNVGVAGADLDGRYAFASTISQTYGPVVPASGSGQVVNDFFVLSPGPGAIGMILLRVMGQRFLEVTFALGTAAAANCLYAKM